MFAKRFRLESLLKTKEVIKPLNESRIRALQDLRGFFVGKILSFIKINTHF